MGRHDTSLGRALAAKGLAAGLYATTKVQTAFGWQTLALLAPGDLVLTRDGGLMPVDSIVHDNRAALWSVRLPAHTFANDTALMLPPGQSVLIETPIAVPFTGEPAALIPATALEGWRGIAPHVPAQTAPILRLIFASEALVSPSLGIWILAEVARRIFELHHLLDVPRRAVLPLPLARQLVASLIAEEAGRGLTQAALRPENRA